MLLTASAARADLPEETFYQTREEISDEALRDVIGIVFLKSIEAPESQLTGDLSLYAPEGDGFRSDGTIPVTELRAVSGWDWDLQSVRKFPVVEQRGDYLHVVIDVQKNERAWLRQLEELEKGYLVEFLSFDSQQWSGDGIELYFLAPQAQTRLYGAPRLEARSHPLSPARPPRRQGALVHDVRIMGMHGNFVQLGEWTDIEDPLAPVGWVPLTDENGLLIIWPVYAPGC
jgi:hypothetical protein